MSRKAIYTIKTEERIGNTHEIIKICLNFARKNRADTFHETNTFIASKKYCDCGMKITIAKLGEALRKYFPLIVQDRREASKEEKKEETV